MIHGLLKLTIKYILNKYINKKDLGKKPAFWWRGKK